MGGIGDGNFGSINHLVYLLSNKLFLFTPSNFFVQNVCEQYFHAFVKPQCSCKFGFILYLYQ